MTLHRFKITKLAPSMGTYIIMDRKKLKTVTLDKRYTHKTFSTVEDAKRYLKMKGR